MKFKKSLPFIAVILCSLNSITLLGEDWSFIHKLVYDDIGRADDIVNADVDGDGNQDLVCSSDGIRWYRNNGGSQPTWTRSDSIASSGEYMGMWAGDFDGDGDIDIVANKKESGPAYWFRNNNHATSWTQFLLLTTGNNVDHSRTYDFNNDNRDDIILQRYNGTAIFYLQSPQDPTGIWPSYQIGTGANGLSLCDVDQDGDMDVIVNNTWLENSGNPAEDNWVKHNIPNTFSGVKNAGGDLNNDGKIDFVFSQEESSGVFVHLAPDFGRQTIFSSGTGMHTMKLDDFDKDGDLDILTANIHGGPAYIFENANGQGTSWIQHDYSCYSAKGTHNAWSGDINNDGMPDFFGKHYEAGSAVEIWYSTLKPEPPPDMKIWFKSDAGVTTINGKVSQWADQSDNYINAVQSSESYRPEYIVNVLNGKPVIRFNEDNNTQLDFNFDPDGLTQLTIAIVSANTRYQCHPTYGCENVVEHHGTLWSPISWQETGSWGTTYLTPMQNTVSVRFGTSEVSNTHIYNRPSSIENNFSYTVATHNGIDEKVFVQGIQVLGYSVQNTTLKNNAGIGWLGRGRADTWFHGDIAEILVYTKALSGTSLTQLHNYLKIRYFIGNDEIDTLPPERPTNLRIVE